jgi:ribonuclease VapC
MSDATYVLDSSAILSVLFHETGGETAITYFAGSAVSSVNLTEVVSKLQDSGVLDDAIEEYVRDLKLTVVPHTESLAIKAGLMRNSTRSLGLSLGDRACLALANERDAIAVTTDKAWTKLDGIARVKLVR